MLSGQQKIQQDTEEAGRGMEARIMHYLNDLLSFNKGSPTIVTVVHVLSSLVIHLPVAQDNRS